MKKTLLMAEKKYSLELFFFPDMALNIKIILQKNNKIVRNWLKYSYATKDLAIES